MDNHTTMNTNQSCSTIEQLKSSPLFHLSLGSKELFHSNFLAWLGENDTTRSLFISLIRYFLLKSKIKVTLNWLDDFQTNPKKYEIRREYMHFDLCILQKNNNKRIPILVLENKVKSIPENEQLTKYHNKFKVNKKQTNFILLTLIEDFIDRSSIEEKWIVVTYKELAHFLNSINYPVDPFIRNILDDYRRFIYLLNNLKDNWIISDTYLLCKKIKDELSSLRIVDLAQKFQVNRLYLELTNKITALATRQQDTLFWKTYKSNHHIKIGIGYSNKSALLDIVVFMDKTIDIDKKKDNINTLHIQLQGNQYRHAYEFEIEEDDYNCLSSCKAKSKEYRVEVDRISQPNINNSNIAVWLNNLSTANDSILCGNIMPSNHLYDSFKGRDKKGCSLFVYKYLTIQLDASIANIVNHLLADINNMLSTISNHNY